MKDWKLTSVLALSATTLAGGLLTNLTAQSPLTQSAITQASATPLLFKTYQAGLNEALWTGKPLFVVFRCER